MTSRDFAGTSAGPLPAPVHDLSSTSAVPRSWWPSPASYAAFKYGEKFQIWILHSTQKKTAGARKNQLGGRPLWVTIRHRSQHMPPENNALARTPISKHMNINGVIGHQALVLALVLGSGPTHDGHAVMQGTQLLLAKKPGRVSLKQKCQ